MSKNLSAIRRERIALRNKLYNKSYKSSIRTSIKKVLIEINNINLNRPQKVNLLLQETYSKIDKAVKKRIIHKNQAARKKAKLAKKVKTMIVN